MSEAAIRAPRMARVRTLVAEQPGWLVVLELYVASRIVSSLLLAGVFATAVAEGLGFASYREHPDLVTFSGLWDSSAYRTIGEHGYPAVLPLDSGGRVAPNVWAFLPLYPVIVHAVAAATGLTFYATGATLSLLFGAGAVAALYLVLLPTRGRSGSIWAATLFSFAPLSFLLQTAYAESLFLLLTFGCLAFAVRHRFLLAGLAGVLAAFTRPGALALSAAIGILAIVALAQRSLPARRLVAAFGAAIAIGIAGLAWPVIAARITGVPGAYVQSELAFWVGLVGHPSFTPGTPWFLLGSRYLGVLGIALVIALLVGMVLFLRRRRLAAIGPFARVYSAAYALYLFAVFLPQQSVFRMLLPLAPLLGDPALDRGPRIRVIMLSACVPLQLAAIILLWFLSFP